MKRFLIKDAKLESEVITGTTTAAGTSTVSDRAGTSSDPYVTRAGYNNVQIFCIAATASGSPTITTKLMGSNQSTTSGASTTTLASTSDTAVAAGDMTVITLDAQNPQGGTYDYVWVQQVFKSGKSVQAILYVMDALDRPVTQTDVDASTTVSG